MSLFLPPCLLPCFLLPVHHDARLAHFLFLMVRARVLQEKISRLRVTSRGGVGMGRNDPRELLSRGVVHSDWLFYLGIENHKVFISISATNVSYNVYTDLSNTHLSLQKWTSTQFFPRLVKDLMVW